MLRRKLIKTSWCEFQKRYIQKSVRLSAAKKEECEIAKIRNIGILAHIDAGKTTTTERMLYYSGLIKHMGEVHHGNTVTDYMDQERQRGITITSAAVTFDWKNYRINLIDTPGHIDFTMEVEQTLRILDGAVVILDGSAGVEAQTITVCRQADKYNIPRIMYVNKMDRPDANFEMSIKSIESKLNVDALPIQFPIKTKGVLNGIIDVVSLEKLIFDQKDSGMRFTRLKLSESEDKNLWEIALEKRRHLTDKLSSMDDELAETIIEQESLDNISPQTLVDSLRRITIHRKGVPVLLGSSYKNIGVQPLMDSVLLYLPSPDQNQQANYYQCFEKNFSAKVFKIIHDKNRGPVSFLRIYTGSIKKGDKIYDIQREQSEQVSRMYIACADDYEEISMIGRGNIVAVSGLKNTVAGDLVTSSKTVANLAKKNLEKRKNIKPEVIENFFALGARILDPVFFCSIESPSLSTQLALDDALKQLEREDPSLRVIYDADSGQTILAGMGELHIDIIKERIRREYKIDAELGPLQIAYKETILNNVKDTCVFEHKIINTNQKVTLTLSLIPNYEGKDTLLLDNSPDCIENVRSIRPNTMQAVLRGVESALLHGPKLSYPVINMGIKLHFLQVEPGTSTNIVSAAVSNSIGKLMKNAVVVLLEPIMELEVVVADEYASNVMADLSKRHAEIQKVDIRGPNRVIECFAPLVELLGYSTALRIVSSGHATFSLKFSHYKSVDPTDEADVIKRITGF